MIFRVPDGENAFFNIFSFIEFSEKKNFSTSFFQIYENLWKRLNEIVENWENFENKGEKETKPHVNRFSTAWKKSEYLFERSFFPPGKTDNLLRFTWRNTRVKNFFIIEKHNFRSRY